MRKVTVIKARAGVDYKRHSFPGHQKASNSSPVSEAPAVVASQPIFTGQAQVNSVDVVHPVATVSPDVLEAVKQEAYESGYRQGLEVGKVEGLAEGRELGQEESLKQAYAEGQEKGYRDGLNTGEEEIQQILKSLNHSFQNVEQFFSERKQELHYWLVEMINEICRRVIRAELRIQPEIILNVVQETLKHVPESSSKITIHMHPRDILHIKQFQPENNDGWSLQEDITIEPGDCRILTDQAEASASIEDRLSASMDVVRDILPEELEGSDA